MDPEFIRGGLWAAFGRRLCFQSLPGGLLEGLWSQGVPKKSSIGAGMARGAKS